LKAEHEIKLQHQYKLWETPVISAFIQFNACDSHFLQLNATLKNALLQTLVIVLYRPQGRKVAWAHSCKKMFSPSLF
jgi:hypothetical protein